jgi:hypothetical protein
MKLHEIKFNIIDKFFYENSNGISINILNPIYESLGRSMNVDLNPDNISEISKTISESQDVSKAFKKFTDSKLNILTILEEDGNNINAIFMALRVGTKVMITDLTSATLTEKVGTLGMVKDALKQAKARNEESYFSIIERN